MSKSEKAGLSFLPWQVSLFLQGMCTVRPSSGLVKSGKQLEQMFKAPPWKSASFPKKKLPCWSPAVYPKGKTRKNDNVESISAIVLDYDAPSWSASRMGEHLETIEIAYAVHTTWSHEDETPRYRVVIFLSRAINPKEFLPVRDHVLSLVGYTDGVDDLKDLARHYALPIRRTASPYEAHLGLSHPPVCVDSLMAEPSDKESSPGVSDLGLCLSQETLVEIDEAGNELPVAGLQQKGPGKYKCSCPFQEDSSFGSAFIRVCKDGRVFLQCTSERHEHDRKQFWLGGSSDKKAATSRGNPKHSVSDRKELLEEIPDHHVKYIETNLAFNFPQGVFYRRERGAWQIESPLRKETVYQHLVGRLEGGMDVRHVNAMIDHVLSRQVYGFDCDSSRGATIPSGVGPRLNLYAHPDLKPVKGNWPRVRGLIEVLCDGDKKSVEWLMHWSAALVQRPERRAMVAVLCLSPQQGIGKSMYGRLLSAVIGRKNSSIVSNRALRDSFNASYITRLLVLADEVGMSGRDADIIAALKAYITDDRVPCRAPYAARTEVDNRTTWWLTSNERRPLMLEEDDRRFTVLVPGGVDGAYRKMLAGCFNPATGEYSQSFETELIGFAHALHSLKVDYRLISRPYGTRARSLIQEASRSSVDQFIALTRRYGPAAMITDYPPGPDFARTTEGVLARATPCELLYGSYATWCARHGRKDIYQEANLRLAMQEIPGVSVKRVLLGGQHFHCYMGLKKEKTSESQPDNVVELIGK